MTNNGRRQESIRLAQKMELSHLKYFLWRISTGIMYSVHTTRAFFFVQPVGCIAKILIQRQWWTHHFKPTKAFILLAYNFIRLNIEHAIRKRKHSHKTQKKKLTEIIKYRPDMCHSKMILLHFRLVYLSDVWKLQSAYVCLKCLWLHIIEVFALEFDHHHHHKKPD